MRILRLPTTLTLLTLLSFWLLPCGAAAQTKAAQTKAAQTAALPTDPQPQADSLLIEEPTDSARLAKMQEQLDEARLNAANLRMELEQIHLANAADSTRRADQKRRIDSLRRVTPGVPVIVEGDTLFMVYTRRGGQTAQQRAESISQEIEDLGKLFLLYPDSVRIESSELFTELMYRGRVLASFTDRDGLWENCSRDQLVVAKREAVVQKLRQMKSDHGLMQLIKRAIHFLLVLLVQFILFRITAWCFRRLRAWIVTLKDRVLKPISIQDYELLDTQRQVNILLSASKLLRYVVVFLLLLLTVPMLFSIFPQTKDLAIKLFSYIWNPVSSIFFGIIAYIPNLFTIFIIWICIRYLVRLFHYLACEIRDTRLKLKGFYADWAMPTYYIIRFLLYAFMIAMIYPYLPGADSGIFQGISVFVGLMVSLGSSTIIGNIIAGLIITYMRSFKIGDRIQLNDTTGHVIEKTALVTRIRTPKNEVVTIPNSFIMSSHTVNYSESAREYGLIIHTEVTIGYDAPWRQVHDLLIRAALNTPGVVDDPRPFVLETSLSDWYPVYQLNAYVHDADRLAQIYSDLHQNIQDCFNEAGVEIMSPHYMATRDGNETTIPKDEKRETIPGALFFGQRPDAPQGTGKKPNR